MSKDELQIVELDSIDCRLDPRPWAFAEENRDAIGAHWRRALMNKPASFNGQILLQHRWEIVEHIAYNHHRRQRR